MKSDGENRFIVPGGSTPRLFYRYLADKVLDWTGVTLIPSDERLVDENSPESNIGMIRENLIGRINKKDKPTLFSFIDRINRSRSDQALSSLKAKLTQLLPPKATFLGIGQDGHTASLFPGYDELDFDTEPSLLIKRDSDPFQRVSISTTFLANTPRLVFLVSGERKRTVIKKIVTNNKNIDHLQVMKIIKMATGRMTFLCDQDAVPYD